MSDAPEGHSSGEGFIRQQDNVECLPTGSWWRVSRRREAKRESSNFRIASQHFNGGNTHTGIEKTEIDHEKTLDHKNSL